MKLLFAAISRTHRNVNVLPVLTLDFLVIGTILFLPLVPAEHAKNSTLSAVSTPDVDLLLLLPSSAGFSSPPLTVTTGSSSLLAPWLPAVILSMYSAYES
jgi:hypothetical protein